MFVFLTRDKIFTQIFFTVCTFVPYAHTNNYTVSPSGALLKQYLQFRISYCEWLETRRCFIAIAFHLCCGICHWEASG